MVKRTEWEHIEQIGLVQDLKNLAVKYPELWGLYAVPNESGKGRMAFIRSALLKKEGVKKGVSDLVLPVPRFRPGRPCLERIVSEESGGGDFGFPFFMGLYVEMKKQPDISPVQNKINRHKPSGEQKAFLDFVLGQGYLGLCANGRAEGLDIFLKYLTLPKIPAADLRIDDDTLEKFGGY